MISRKFSKAAWQTLAILARLAITSTRAIAAELPEITTETGWKCLFQGQDLVHWKTVAQDGEPADPNTWIVEDGTLTRKGKAYLRSKDQYRDLILDLEFNVGPPRGEKRTNSGVFLRHKLVPN